MGVEPTQVRSKPKKKRFTSEERTALMLFLLLMSSVVVGMIGYELARVRSAEEFVLELEDGHFFAGKGVDISDTVLAVQVYTIPRVIPPSGGNFTVENIRLWENRTYTYVSFPDANLIFSGDQAERFIVGSQVQFTLWNQKYDGCEECVRTYGFKEMPEEIYNHYILGLYRLYLSGSGGVDELNTLPWALKPRVRYWN